MNMKFETFAGLLETQVRKTVQEGTEVSLHRIRKINGCRTALVIRNQGDAVARNLYLEPFFRQYEEGAEIEAIADRLLESQQTDLLPECMQHLPDLMEWENVKDRIVIRMINAEKNQELLKELPYQMFQDLAIIFACVLKNTNEETVSFLVQHGHLRYWPCEFQELLQQAKHNTRAIFPPEITEIGSVIDPFGSKERKEIEELDRDIFYVMSNSSMQYGFTGILYTDLMERFAGRFGNFYILPSSLHEALLVPDTGEMKEQFLQIVKTVNAEHVAPEDFLADSVYYYHADRKEIERITD